MAPWTPPTTTASPPSSEPPDEERHHELANARWDLEHRPETAHGRDAHQIAADALTASRALPERHLEPVEFAAGEYPAWTPGQALALRR